MIGSRIVGRARAKGRTERLPERFERKEFLRVRLAEEHSLAVEVLRAVNP
jgi:hypothetical protein